MAQQRSFRADGIHRHRILALQIRSAQIQEAILEKNQRLEKQI